MKTGISKIIERFKPQPCPYCGERCISFGRRMYAGARWYREAKCPQCGATLKLGWKFFTAKYISIFIYAGSYWLLIDHTDITEHSGWLFVITALYAIAAVVADIAFGLFAPLDYEETWKYPKPAKKEDETVD